MKKTHFKTNVLIKDIIGKGLINDDNLAVVELVKNSFDAKASNVNITFLNLGIKNEDDQDDRVSKLIIKDNGLGMDDEDIENKWLNIAYSEKKDKSDVTSHVFAGDKGVGRFSCDRLGMHLNLYSKKRDSPIFHVEINWPDFETGNIDTTIQSIDIVINEIDENTLKTRGHDIGVQGTILEMNSLRANWTKQKIRNLKIQYLSKLINPNQNYVKNDIKLMLKVSDYPEYSGLIKNHVFKNLEFRTTSIESYTSYKEKTNDLYVTTILKHKGEEVLKIVEKNNRFRDLKQVKIVVYYLNTYAKARFYKESGERTKDYGSIFLFLNGFRVSPYGEAENDWLGLELRKAQGQQRFFSSRDIIGRIEVTDLEGIFRPVSSREGLINNYTFSLLVDKDALIEGYDDEDAKKEYGLFYQTITALEKYVVNGLKWDSAVSKNYADEFEEALIKSQHPLEEIYAEAENEKDQRCLEALQSILRIRKGEIISIKINNELVLKLLESEEEKSRKFIKSLDRFGAKIEHSTADAIDKIKLIIKDKEEEISRQKAKLSIEEKKRKEAEEKAAQEEKKRQQAEEKAQKAEAKSKEEELKRKEAELREREAKLRAEEAKITAEKEKAAREKAEAEAEAKKLELEVEKKKNKYLSYKRSTIDDDTAGLIHHISLLNDIPDLVNILIKSINVGNVDKKIIYEELIKIKKRAEKVLTVSKLITGADFKKQIDKQKIDIPKYIEEYIENYYEFNDPQALTLRCVNNGGSFYKQVSPLELSIILDNLVSNAKKWKAQNILFEIEKKSDNKIQVLVTDDGLGLSLNLMDNPEQIFELGVTETNGAGIGMFYVRSLLNGMGGEINFNGNNSKLKGASFLIKI